MDFTVEWTWRIPDRGRRKEEITRAFWRMEPSRAGDKQTAYGLEDVEVETDVMEITADNDMFTLYRVEEGK